MSFLVLRKNHLDPWMVFSYSIVLTSFQCATSNLKDIKFIVVAYAMFYHLYTNNWLSKFFSGRRCNFPSIWEGEYFQLGYSSPLVVSNNTISEKGECVWSSGSQYVLEGVESGKHKLIVCCCPSNQYSKIIWIGYISYKNFNQKRKN